VTATMTKSERTELTQLIRKREKVLRSKLDERAAILMAQFEEQLRTTYPYHTDEVWNEVYQYAEKAVEEAKKKVIERNAELGIPADFAPSIHIGWFNAGKQASEKNWASLRRTAQVQVDAMVATARTKIEQLSYEAQAEIVASGIQSEAAKAFFERLPSFESLMPPLQIDDVRKLLK
jgi:hypothetical protein